MKTYKDIPHLLTGLCDKFLASRRTNYSDPRLAGWGQFLDAENHSDQIGTYGTSAAILFSKIAQNPVDDAGVAAQLEHFLSSPEAAPKLLVQNVRLAFMLLALSTHSDQSFRQLRERVFGLLTSRQLGNGAWPDAFSTDYTVPGYPRPETTAWVMLALHRSGDGQDALRKARKYLADQIANNTTPNALTPFSLGALLYTWDDSPVPARLRMLAHRALAKLYRSTDEGISFFDYLRSSGTKPKPRIARDYICYPNLLPQALLLDGLSRISKGATGLKLSRQRFVLLQIIHSCVRNQHFFKHSGAVYASSVDQALLALSFEILDQRYSHLNAALHFVYLCYDNRIVKFGSNIGIPILLLVAAAVAIVDVTMLADVVGGTDQGTPGAWLVQHDKLVRILAARSHLGNSASPECLLEKGTGQRTVMKVFDALWGAYTVPSYLKPLVMAPEFRRLSNVRLLNVNSPSLASLSDVTRYSHTLGVLRLALENPMLGFSAEEHRAFLAAVLVHDAGTPAFAHLFEYFLGERHDWSHEAVTPSLLKGTLSPDEHATQIFYSQKPRFKNLCDAAKVDFNIVCSIVGKSNRASPLLFGALDYDNLDNVARMNLFLGQEVHFSRLLRVASELGVTGDSRVTLPVSIRSDVTYWLKLRKEAYEVLVFDALTVSAQAVLSDCN